MNRHFSTARALILSLLSLAASATWLPAQVTGLFREIFDNIGGGVAVADLTNSAPFIANQPTSSGIITIFETETGRADNYGQRVRGYLTPTNSATYYFAISSDDASDLYLSTDGSSANKTRICYVSAWADSRQFTKEGNQVSGGRALVAGQKYYIEALMKEGGGGDNLAVAWKTTGTFANGDAPIPGTFLSYDTSVTIVNQPTNTTTIEGNPVSFTVGVQSLSLIDYQWQRNSNNIAGERSSTLVLTNPRLSDDGAYYRAIVTNVAATNISVNARLTVLPDTNAPTLTLAFNSSATNFVVFFSEPVNPATATNALNYTVSGGIAVQGASMIDVRSVLLLVSPLTVGNSYTVTVNNVTDTAAAQNAVAAGSTTDFVAATATTAAIGNPPPTGSTTVVAGGVDLTAASGNMVGTFDSCQFYNIRRAGDFDLKVRLQDLTAVTLWTKAGLMARVSLNTNSPYAAAFSTPGMGGSQFSWRGATNGLVNASGFFPTTYPNTWLRLQRAGNLFSGYASADGNVWTFLGSSTVAMPSVVYFGLSASSGVPGTPATALFREYQDVQTATLAATPPSIEPLGASSRRSGLVISEIMYRPRPTGGSNALEFIELYNSQSWSENIGGYRISGDVDYTFAAGTTIPAGGYLVIARYPELVQSSYGIAGVFGPWGSNSLGNATGVVRLRGKVDEILLEVNYSGDAPWPLAADGAGHSLVLARPSYGEAYPQAWSASDRVGGSPGQAEPFTTAVASGVVINEWLAHTDDPMLDFVELFNTGSQMIDLSGCWLSDSRTALADGATTNKFLIPNGTVIPARGFVSFEQNQLGFALDSGGESIYFASPDRMKVLDAVSFEGQANGVASGRVPDGSPYFQALASRTPLAANSGPLEQDIVINEIMHTPITGQVADEYVELYNRGTNTVNLGGWSFRSGINFTFPANTVMPPGGYLVVAADAAHLRANYPALNAANCLSNFNGKISGSGERLALYQPDLVISTNAGGVRVTNKIWIAVSDVSYGTGGRWGNWNDGGGSSLELVDPHADITQPANWADSDESGKGQWTLIELTGAIGETLGSPINDNLELFLLGSGECLVDEVELRVGAGANVITNGGFESGLNNWVLQGSHDFSTIEPAGYAGAQSLHLRAASRGDNGGNRIRTEPFTAVSGTITVRARVKWVRGFPELLVRLHGGGFEAYGPMQISPALGTPGAPNSRLAGNAGPAVFDVSHAPVLPAPGQAVVVSARASDPDGVTLRCQYRVDPNNAYATVNMLDNGTGGDAVAGDGLYSATVPGQNSGVVVAFYLEAADGLNVTNTFPQDVFPQAPLTRCFPNDAVTRECVLRWGERQMAGTFATYHLWLTESNRLRWEKRAPLNNALLDGTFVYNTSRAIYNSTPLYAGSPWHRGAMTTGPTGGNRVDYVMNFRDDDRLLGATDFVLNNPGNPGGTATSDLSAQTEQASYILFKEIGVHYNHRRYIHFFVNGSQRSTTGDRTGNFIFEDSQQPNADVIDQWFSNDPDGELYKVEDWFEFNDNGFDFSSNNDADLSRRSTTINGTPGVVVISPYRFMFRKRAVGAGESANDYTSFWALLNAISPASDPLSATITNLPAVDAVADVDQWMRIFACQRTAGNWDSYGWERGKNAYTYKGLNGLFQQMTWDIDFTMGVGGRAANQDLFSTVNDPRLVAMLNTPVYRRAYFRAFSDIVNGPLNNSFMDPILDAKAAALTANNVNFDPGFVTTIKTYVGARRTYILTQLATVDSPFSVTTTNYLLATNNFVTYTGRAPVSAATVRVNGRDYPITWSFTIGTTPTTWTIKLALAPGTNQIVFQGIDLKGNPISGFSVTNTANYSGPVVAPQDGVVFNEIMFRPTTPDADFVELFNRSSNVAFDLSGWRLNGLGYTFPGGSILSPRQYLVLAKDRTVFAATYGTAIPVFDTYGANLDGNGETLTLYRPLSPSGEEVVDRVRYESATPWPQNAATNGYTLQLVDPIQDNSRVANWTDGSGWRFFSFTTNISISRLSLIFDATGGDVYLDDLSLVPGSIPGVGVNSIVNGAFESPLIAPWVATGVSTNSHVTNGVAHSGGGSLHLIQKVGAAALTSFYQDVNPAVVTNTAYTLSGWYLPGTNKNFTLRAGSFFQAKPDLRVGATPGAPNVTAQAVLPYPTLWLNEVQPVNLDGIADHTAVREPFIEIYNSGTNVVSLDGIYLSDNYTNLGQWAFPAGATINPGEFRVVFADGQPGQTTPTEWHASFRLDASSAQVALNRTNSSLEILDYLNFASLRTNLSYGSFPDGQPFFRQAFYHATPGGTNDGSDAPITVVINEWMADNLGIFADPADGDYEDWFEIRNSGTNIANLEGYYLTDNLTNKTQFRIPAGYSIPPGGYLLVWADEETGQNSTNRADLHVNFKLAKSGESIGIFSSGGVPIDTITFTNQFTDVSQGRCPDGGAGITFFTNSIFISSTPRTANYCSTGGNTAPVPDPIASRTVHLGQVISLTATAMDADLPSQTLTYTLDAAPPGASIQPGTGLFTWNTTGAVAPGTNAIIVRVTDNGTPPLSGTTAFEIVVLPAFSAVTLNGTQMTCSWATTPGAHYQVVFKQNLSDPLWTTYGPVQTGTGAPLTVTIDTSTGPKGFYQILVTDY